MSVTTETTQPTRADCLSTYGPLLRGALWGVVGFAAGALSMSFAQEAYSLTELGVVVGYLGGLTGWILGVGAWEAVIRPLFGGSSRWDSGRGFGRYLRFHTDHKVIGLQYLVTAGATFLLAGLLAMLMRTELMTADLDLFPTN